MGVIGALLYGLKAILTKMAAERDVDPMALTLSRSVC